MTAKLHEVIKRITITDANTGEEILSKTYRGSQNGRGWLIVYRKTAALIASGKLSIAPIRLFMFLTAYCEWNSSYTTTRADLAHKLNISRPALNRAISELKSVNLITETKTNGTTTFWLNPEFITQGRDHAARIEHYATYQIPDNHDI